MKEKEKAGKNYVKAGLDRGVGTSNRQCCVYVLRPLGILHDVLRTSRLESVVGKVWYGTWAGTSSQVPKLAIGRGESSIESIHRVHSKGTMSGAGPAAQQQQYGVAAAQ